MNKRLFIIIGSIVILVLLGAGLAVMSQKKQPSGENLIDDSQSETIENKTLKELMSLSGSQECNFVDPASGNEGVIYVASGKLRGDFSSKSTETNESHVIADGETVYIWSEGETKGFKLSQTSIENLTDGYESLNVNKKVDYSCMPWAQSDGLFVPPSDIAFSDYSSLIPSTLPSGNINVTCAACASLTGESKAQCEQALKCN